MSVRRLLLAAALFVSSTPALAQETVPFDSGRWQLVAGEFVHHLGRPSLQGTAVLDTRFLDGTIEFDIAVDGRRSYPGVVFRAQEDNTFEHVYVRPHRAGLYPDAVQYTPVMKGAAGWQLYNGEGFTSPVELPTDEWIPVRITVHGGQAEVYVGETEEPTLAIARLQLTPAAGTLGLTGPADGSAYFSNFRFREDSDTPPAEPESVVTPPGTLGDWWISRVYPAERVPRETYPHFYSIFGAQWEHQDADATGLVDVGRLRARANQAGDLVLARTFFFSDEERDVTLTLGYSDDVEFFFNGRRLFSGRSGYQYRDPSFLGIVGPFDDVHVRAQKGLNEVFLMVTERFGGWGFRVQASPEVEPPRVDHDATEPLWETPADFLTSETALYDPDREVLYVSSFDNTYTQKEEGAQFISRVSLDGQILEREWVRGLRAPTGMAIWHDTLYVAERQHMAAVDLESGRIVARWEIPDADFPNDLAIGEDGTIYISDTRPSNWAESRIYRFRDGVFDVFANEGISRANGLWVHDGALLVGNSGDGFLKRVGLSDGRVEKIVSLGAGIIDGIRVDENGDYLVSHWEGQVYRISPDGSVVEILDTLPLGRNTADFEYLPDRRMLIFPTFLGNSVAAYSVR